MTYRIIFSYTNHFCEGTYQIAYAACASVKTDAESSDPVRVLYDGLIDKEHLIAGKNSIICYDDEGNISTVFINIRFDD